jgi:16S rRNA (cytidine1402-2'-O)-methyltransferase
VITLSRRATKTPVRARDARRAETGSDRSLKHGRLAIVSTPIGNLGDITLRALTTLREVDVILAEDTRRTRQLCAKHGVDTPLESFHSHSSENKRHQILARLAGGTNFALTTDAGTPCLSDPGMLLVNDAHNQGTQVEVIPGPSAVTAAMAVCGLQGDRFTFLGFIPRTGTRRKALLDQAGVSPDASVLFESPQRLRATLKDLASRCGDRRVAVCRELTKLHEEVVRGTAQEVLAQFESRESIQGEIVIVIEAQPEIRQDSPTDEPDYQSSRAQVARCSTPPPRARS